MSELNEKINELDEYNFVRTVLGKDELVGRRDELALLKESMFKKRMKNTILVGPSGCGKTAILEQFAYEMRHHFDIVELDIASCVAGTSLRGQFEEKLVSFLSYIVEKNRTQPKKTIVYIDEIHTVYDAGGSEGAVDASNILKSYLSRGEVTIIGATTVDEYYNTIAKDRALSRRLSPIFIKELGGKANLDILYKFNDGDLSQELVDYIYERSKELKGSNPDKAIEILDRCIARQKFTGKYMTVQGVNSILKFMKEGIIK